MKILAIETSAKSVSAAVVENGVPLASAYQNMGLTHSRTLMPLVDGMLSAAGLRVQDMDLLAAANGPGSFTRPAHRRVRPEGPGGALEKPCCGVSTLAAMARNLAIWRASSSAPWTPGAIRCTTPCSWPMTVF